MPRSYSLKPRIRANKGSMWNVNVVITCVTIDDDISSSENRSEGSRARTRIRIQKKISFIRAYSKVKTSECVSNLELLFQRMNDVDIFLQSCTGESI